jgi:sugar lactone lactonase YvrE
VGRAFRIALSVLLVLLVVAVLAVRSRYGGGRPYPDVGGPPVLPGDRLEAVLAFGEPIGNVAVSRDGRLFFTVHPEARTPGPKLFEWLAGRAVPYPDESAQDALFETPLGLVVDRRDRLWVIDHGRHGFGTPRLLAFDLASAALVHDHRFGPEAAPRGSFLQDLQLSPDGGTAFIADLSFWRRRPALVVHDVASGRDRRLLEGHPALAAQDWIIRTPARRMVFFGGLAAMKPGIDGLAVAPDGSWLAFGAMSHDTLFRVPTAALLDASVSDRGLAALVEPLGPKPLSDGLSADLEGGIWITDVEHGAVLRRAPDGRLETWIRSPRVRWADALCFGPEGWLYVADSALPEVILRSRRHIAAQAPYHVYRFRPGIAGVPGH